MNEAEVEEIASGMFDEIMLVCSILIQIDERGGNQAFGTNEHYQEAIRLAKVWTNKEAADGNANGNNNRQEQEAQD